MTTAAPPAFRRTLVLVVVAGIVLGWFVVAEFASQAWYLSHESKLPKNPIPVTGEEISKRVHDFAEGGGLQISEKNIGAAAMEMLKCSYGETLIWRNFEGVMSAVTVLKWDERSVVGGVESMHNPGTCLKAAGWDVGAQTVFGVENYCGVTCEVTKWAVSQNSIQMQAYSAVFRRYAETEAEKASPKFWNNMRLNSVLSGRRDAPVLILLAYLPADTERQTDASFRHIMRAVFCGESR